MTLQNAYGDKEFPVRARWRWRKIVTAARRQRNSRADKALIFVIFFSVAGVLIIALWGVGSLTSTTFDSFMQDDNLFGKFIGVVMVIAIPTLFMSWLLSFGDAGLPRREQRRYQRLAQATPLTERQGQILALDAVSDFDIGGWNRSLEYLPLWCAMPAPLRTKHEKNASYQPFLSFQLTGVDSLRNHLDQAQTIVSTVDAEHRIERALGEDSLSLKFVDVLSNPEAAEPVQRLASLTGNTEAAIRKLGEAPAGSPAPLLWAADVMLTIGLVRSVYVAEYLDAELAWKYLEQLGKVAFGTFSSSDEYWANARIGLAFVSNSREAVQRFDTTYRDLKLSRWPAILTTFPHNAADQIPDVVRNLRAKTPLAD